MASGPRSLLAPWIGGASVSPVPTSFTFAGVRSPLAFWLGGAAFLTPQTGRAGAWNSRVGYWVGGLNGFSGNVISIEQGVRQYRVERASSWQGGADQAQKAC